jgi:hypothetical protein
MIESSVLFSFDPIAIVDLRRDIKLLIENLSCLGFTNAPTSFDEDADDGSIEILNNSSTRSDSESDDSELEDDDEQDDDDDQKNEDMESKCESRSNAHSGRASTSTMNAHIVNSTDMFIRGYI